MQGIYKGIYKFRAGDIVFPVEWIKKKSHFYSFMVGADDSVCPMGKILDKQDLTIFTIYNFMFETDDMVFLIQRMQE